MTLFSERLVSDLQRLRAARHSFLGQVCSDQGQRYRNVLEQLVHQVDDPLATRARELLSSLDNRRFFQAYAELIAAAMVRRGGGEIEGLEGEGPLLVARCPGGERCNLSVLSFIHKSRPAPDRATIGRLVKTLERVAGQQRLIVAVHRWLPHDLDPEPIRRAVEMWIGQVVSGAWEGRYASYEDERISLEFGLVDGKAGSGPRVVAALGPFLSRSSIAAVENRVLTELERYRLGPNGGQRLLLLCVGDQPWSITGGYVRDFLYGPARCTRVDHEGGRRVVSYEFGTDAAAAGSLFGDPLYRDLAGFLWVGRDQDEPHRVWGRGYLNPWAARPLAPEIVSCLPLLTTTDAAGGAPVLSWRNRDAGAVSLV